MNGPKGELSERIHRDIDVKQDGEQLVVTRPTDRGEHRALHGLTRSLVANMVEGVTNGYEKRLEIQGVGYRAQLKGKNLELAVGYSHPVPIPAPDGIEFEVPAADPRRRQRHLQAARRRDRGDHPQAAPAGALQGQGDPLRGRVRRSARSGSAHERPHQGEPPPQAPPPRAREDLRHGRASAHLRVPLQPRASPRSWSTTSPAARWPPSPGSSPSCARSAKPTRTARAGALLAERAKAAGVRRPSSTAAATSTTAMSSLRRGDPRGRPDGLRPGRSDRYPLPLPMPSIR